MQLTRRCSEHMFRLLYYCLLLTLRTGEASTFPMTRKQTTLIDRPDGVEAGDVPSYETMAEEPAGQHPGGEKTNGAPSERSGDAEKLERRLPKALIIGVKKAGTRALLEFLRLHPDVRATGPETHFFDRHYNKGIEWYRLQMPLTLPEQITMEKTPSYFVTEEVPARIRNTLPDARLLVVVRDPVTRALSDYAQTASKRPDTTLPFEALAFRRRKRRKNGGFTSNFRHQPNRKRRTSNDGNGTISSGRTSTSGSPGIDSEGSATPHYSAHRSARRTFTGKVNYRKNTLERDQALDTKNTPKNAIEENDRVISTGQALHSKEHNYIWHARNTMPNYMLASLNMTQAGPDWLSQTHRHNRDGDGNSIPKDVPSITTKEKGTSASFTGLRSEARTSDNDVPNTNDYEAINRDCGTVSHSNKNSTCWNASSDVDEAWSGIRIGLYANHLAQWLRHFPQSQIHVVSGEELVRNPAREMAMVQDFLGLRRLVSEDHFYFNRTKGFPCLKKSEGSGSPHCLGKTKGRTHPRLSEENVRRLRKFFEPHNEEFFKLVQRDFGWERAR